METNTPPLPPPGMPAGDSIAQRNPDRCRVCALPLPAGAVAADGICSRRCAGRRRESAAVAQDAAVLKERILSAMASLKPGATMCPGALSQLMLPGTSQPLTLLRPLLFELAEAGRLRLSQKGTATLWWKIRGPFRVAGK